MTLLKPFWSILGPPAQTLVSGLLRGGLGDTGGLPPVCHDWQTLWGWTGCWGRAPAHQSKAWPTSHHTHQTYKMSWSRSPFPVSDRHFTKRASTAYSAQTHGKVKILFFLAAGFIAQLWYFTSSCKDGKIGSKWCSPDKAAVKFYTVTKEATFPLETIIRKRKEKERVWKDELHQICGKWPCYTLLRDLHSFYAVVSGLDTWEGKSMWGCYYVQCVLCSGTAAGPLCQICCTSWWDWWLPK